MQSFFESNSGRILVISIIVVMMLLIVLISRRDAERESSSRTHRTDIQALTISALMIALATILGQIKLFSMPQGGSVTLLSLLPIAVCAYLLGTKRGIIAGIALGLLNLLFGPQVVHPVQLLMDYPVAFGALGLAGLTRNAKHGLTIGYLIGVAGRYISSVLSGAIFFGAYAPEGFNAWTWSIWYNLTYLGMEAILGVIVINLPPVKKMLQTLRSQC